MKTFKAKACGKWILSGEHSVLRGGEMILFPLDQIGFEISYHLTSNPWSVTFDSPFFDKKHHFHYVQVIKKALALAGQENAKGNFNLKCHIPIAAGLGSSASFCVCLMRIFSQLKWIEKSKISLLARHLEDEFHGKSSGADVQVIHYEKPILFRSFDDIEILKTQWKPCFKLLDTGERSSTAKQINKVDEFVRNDPQKSGEVDEIMKESVCLCKEALNTQAEKGFSLLKEGIEKASLCFKAWGLYSQTTQDKIQEVKNNGALAAKLTGSGGGGFILALYQK